MAFWGNLIAPEDCRVCGLRLRDFTRIPVCSTCLAPPEPLRPDVFCVQCRTAFHNDRPLDEYGRCRACRLGVRGFDAAYSFGEYGGGLRKLIHLYKFDGILTLEHPLSQWLAVALPRDERPDLIVPVPLHWLRRWRRGYDQAWRLASALSHRTGIPCGQVLRRKRKTRPQTSLTRAERRLNVRGAFEAPRPDRIRGKTVLLVDDVYTTGATLGECAKSLRAAGARRVIVLTVARADRREGTEAPPLRARARAAGR